MDERLSCDSSQDTEVRLTRFRHSLDQLTTDMQAKPSKLSARFQQDGDQKWPWSRASSEDQLQKGSKFDAQLPDSNLRQVVLDPVLLRDAADLDKSPANIKAPFRVVWSQLAFEVDTTSYDQLLARSLNKLKSVFTSAQQDEKQSQPTTSNNKRVIFENLNGHINSGEISAILGPSGVGKTSLINAICSKTKANYRGQVQLVGGSSSPSRMRVSVIPQKDYLMDRLTVRENLLFASRMLNPDADFDHEANICRLAQTLNLNYCLDSSASSISGGEYKRVSIAQELLKRPDILILDEPTSGLDSVNCKNLIRSLRSLLDASHRGAMNPLAIVLTIHQPDVEIFHMFDHIYCMARGGRTVYEGHPSQALQVIRSQSGMPAIDQEENSYGAVNPANLLIEIASEFVYGAAPIERLNKYQLKQFEDQRATPSPTQLQSGGSWPSMANHLVAPRAKLTSSPSHSNYSLASTPSTVTTTASSDHQFASKAQKRKTFLRDKRLNSKVDHRGKFWLQMALLARRNFVSDLRDPLLTGASVVFHLLIPFVMYIAYSQRVGQAKACPAVHREMELLALASNQTSNKILELQEELTVALECSTMFFLSTYCFSLRSLLVAALSFPLSMHVLVKESRNGWYNVPAYVLAKIVSSFLTEVILPVVSVIMIYWVLDMPHSQHQWRLWAVALVMALVSLVSAVQGLIWGALSMDSIQSAIFLASASSLPLVLLSGFTARIKQMPHFMQALSWISPYRYSSDAINMIRFGFGLCACNEDTDAYLRTKPASFSDLPDRMKPLFSFYLTNNAPDDATSAEENTLNATISATPQQQQIAGISYDLMLSPSTRNDMLKRLEAQELDLFAKMAELVSKSFTYGREINGCESVRSQLLYIGGFPSDDHLPLYYAGLAIMFLLLNLVLFLVVRSRVSKRV